MSHLARAPWFHHGIDSKAMGFLRRPNRSIRACGITEATK